MLKLVRVKDSQNWYVRGTVARVRLFESARTADKAQAESYRIRRETETWEREQLGLDKRRPVTFAYACACYGETKNDKVKDMLVPINDYFKERTIDQIGQSEIDKGAQALFPNCKASTRIREFYTPTIAVLNHAAATALPGSSVVRIKKPKVAHVQREWNTDRDIDQILPQCGLHLRAVVLFMTQTGVRVGEAIRLTPNSFAMVKGYAHVGKTKNGKPRIVPLTAELQEAIAAIMPKDPFAPVFGYTHRTSVNTAIKRACRRLYKATKGKIDIRTSPHKIGRHSFAARLLAAGESLKVVQQAGGWETIQVVANTYGHLEQSAVHETMLRVANGGRK